MFSNINWPCSVSIIRFDLVKKKGVKILFDEQAQLAESQPIKLSIEEQLAGQQEQINKLEESLSHFKKQRDIGKGLQLVGMLGSTVFTVLAVNAALDQNKNSPPKIGIAFSGVWMVGFLIDIDASRHLRRRNLH